MFDVSDNVTKINTINRRLFLISVAKVVVFLGLTTRLFSLQVKEKNRYLTLSDKNRIREWKLPPIRGEFKDYFNKVISGNNEVYQLHIIPEEIENFRYVAIRLKNILSLSDKQFQFILKKKKEIKPWEAIVVSDNLSWEQFSKVNSYLYELEGVNLYYLFHVSILIRKLIHIF